MVSNFVPRRCFSAVCSSEIKKSNLVERGSVYVHWPFCSQLCTYCNFNKYVRSKVDMEGMIRSLERELEEMLRLSGINRVTSVYFGGGTPSLAIPSMVESVLNVIQRKQSLDSGAEVTLEANPSSIDLFKLRSFKAAGVNRLSLGIQSLKNEDLILLNRDHTSLQAIRSLELSNTVYNGRINVDLIFGRPNQSLQSWIPEVCEVSDMSCNHMSVYQLTVEHGTQLSKDVNNGKISLPDNDEMADMYEASVSGFESCHNQGYWHGRSYIGIGPGAHSRFKHEKKYIKSVNVLEPNSWMKKVEKDGHGMKLVKKITRYERLQEILITSLRTTQGLTNEIWHDFSSIPIQQVFSDKHSTIFKCIHDDLLVVDKSGIRATSRGLQVVDSILPFCCDCLQTIESSITD